MKVVFLSFANNQERPLPSLSREDEGVFSALINRSLKGHYLIHRESFAGLESINKFLDKYERQLCLFSYSGHADGQSLHLDSDQANALGIARQLGRSAENGSLKLVVLNGCSTAGQVKALLDAGVPAVVATSASVEDKSACEFGLRFFRGLGEKRLSIRDAFASALDAAQTASASTIVPVTDRGASWVGATGPLWGLFGSDEVLNENPLPVSLQGRQYASTYTPNEELTQVLFDTLLASGSRDIRNLKEAEDDGDYIEIGDKQTAIVNILPYPIAIHLQKLLCPVAQTDEGYDKIGANRLKQIGELFQTTTELLTYIMLAQLWELRLLGRVHQLPAALVKEVKDFFYLPAASRRVYDHLPLIRQIRLFLEEAPSADTDYFITELKQLKELTVEGHPFALACGYLFNLRRQSQNGPFAESDIADVCEEAEHHLSVAFAQLGFLHRYNLTSIQDIDVEKYRHEKRARYNHAVVKLMRAFGKPEHNYFRLDHLLDNRGVVLLKGQAKVIDPRRRQFEGGEMQYLNLSPFVIDRNAFESDADLSNLLFFDYYHLAEDTYLFKSVKQPLSQRDQLRIDPQRTDFRGVRIQLSAFRELILNEQPIDE